MPAIAGPFNLDDIVIRAKVEVDPHTAAITVTSDPLPIIKEGIPLDIRTISVNVDRVGFMFNPTNCTPRSVAGAIASTGGMGAAGAANAAVSTPFGVATCRSLPFKPVFSAQAPAKASKAGGVSLAVKVSAKGGPQPGGGEANIEKVKVDLPKQLPSRLTTLQKACPAGVFAANPAACPAPSLVGAATAVTPMLAHPLAGPAYLVSHGGAALPDLVIVLRGEGITIDLEGQTSISKGHHFEHVQIAPRRAAQHVRPRAPGRAAFAARREPSREREVQPVRADAADAHGDRRPERCGCQTEHQDRNYWMSTHPPEAGQGQARRQAESE